MRRESAAAILLHLQSGDVKCFPILSLDLVMIDAGIFSENDFRHGIGESDVRLQADITFNDGGLAVCLSHEENSRSSHGRFTGGSGNENRVDWVVHDGALGNAD